MPPKRKGTTPTRKKDGRTTRSSSAKKNKKNVTDSEPEVASDEEEDSSFFDKSQLQSVMKFDFQELLNNPAFEDMKLICRMSPDELNLQYWKDTGLKDPILFQCDPLRLGMKMPKADEFSVDTVLEIVGANRMIEVVEVSKQSSVKMSLGEFVQYYNTPKEKREKLYNVLSLEFSVTHMQDLIQSPKLVRDIDWIDNFWPDGLRQRYLTFNKHGNYFIHHTYPKVQNYCLMSVADCYTDFHIDFGGTSVWYHVLKGEKVFWLIEPNTSNLRLYEEFIKNPEQTGFFGDVVDKCTRVRLKPGDTMIIPSGWIHAVFTPVDSLVFGGNFLHSRQCDMQIKVLQSENRINVTKKFRFPYMEELELYVIANVVEECTGRKYLRKIEPDQRYDYVGKKFIEARKHHKAITYEDYMNGPQVDADDLIEETSTNDTEDGYINVIAMHAENSMLFKGTLGDLSMEEEADDDTDGGLGDSEGTKTKKPSEASNQSADPLVFYHEASILHDLHGRSTAAHRNPVPEDEPELQLNERALKMINTTLLYQYEKLCDYLRKKRVIDVPEGITRPASMLKAFHAVLTRRREQLVEKQFSLEPSPWCPKPKRTGKKTPLNSPSPVKTIKTEDEEEELQFEPQLESEKNPEMVVVKTELDTEAEAEPPINVDLIIKDEEHKMDEPESSKKMPVLVKAARTESVIKSQARPESDTAPVKSEPKTPVTPKAEKEKPLFEDIPYEGELRHLNTEFVIPKKHSSVSKKPSVEEPPAKVERKDSKKDSRRDSKSKDSSNEKKETEEPEENDEDDEEDLDDEEKAQLVKEKKKQEREEKKKARDAAKAEKEKAKAEKERKKSQASFEDALKKKDAGSKGRKKTDKKHEKPQFVGGLPTAAISEGPNVNTLYNYDPMAVSMKLGGGQLKSAYRKTKQNIEPPKEKTIYKLEAKPKPEGEEEPMDVDAEGTSSQDVHHSQQQGPLSVSTRMSQDSYGYPAPSSSGYHQNDAQPSPSFRRNSFGRSEHPYQPDRSFSNTSSPAAAISPTQSQSRNRRESFNDWPSRRDYNNSAEPSPRDSQSNTPSYTNGRRASQNSGRTYSQESMSPVTTPYGAGAGSSQRSTTPPMPPPTGPSFSSSIYQPSMPHYSQSQEELTPTKKSPSDESRRRSDPRSKRPVIPERPRLEPGDAIMQINRITVELNRLNQMQF